MEGENRNEVHATHCSHQLTLNTTSARANIEEHHDEGSIMVQKASIFEKSKQADIALAFFQ